MPYIHTRATYVCYVRMAYVNSRAFYPLRNGQWIKARTAGTLFTHYVPRFLPLTYRAFYPLRKALFTHYVPRLNYVPRLSEARIACLTCARIACLT